MTRAAIASTTANSPATMNNTFSLNNTISPVFYNLLLFFEISAEYKL